MLKSLLLAILLLQSSPSSNDPGMFVQALQLVQTYGTGEAASPVNDRALKSSLAKAIGQDRLLRWEQLKPSFTAEMFRKLAGDDDAITGQEIDVALKSAVPKSREKLLPALREYGEFLATTYDMISPSHLDASQQLADWVAKNYAPAKPLHVIIVCTGNSRRSMLAAHLGNLAAAYHGVDAIRFHSGGTAPTAFNRRTIETLKAIGFEITATGEEATRGDLKTPNPKYQVTWGQGFTTLEYSKRYSDAPNPSAGFAAVMVCSEADSECPSVPGAALRLSMPFLDPKSFDDGKYETAKYAERRDDIGRTFMAVMAMVARKVNTQKQ